MRENYLKECGNMKKLILVLVLVAFIFMPVAVFAASGMKIVKQNTSSTETQYSAPTYAGSIYSGYVYSYGNGPGGSASFVATSNLTLNSSMLSQLMGAYGGAIANALSSIAPSVGSEVSAVSGVFAWNGGGASAFGDYSAPDLTSLAVSCTPGRCYGCGSSGWGLSGSQTFVTGVNVSVSSSKSTSVVGKKIVQTSNTKETNSYSQGQVDVYTGSGYKYISPIILDMTGKGIIEASNGQYLPHRSFDTSNLMMIDFFNNGFEIAMEWVGPNDGLLVAPKADGSVDATCLFGTNGGYDNGFEKLSMWDANKNGKIEGDELNTLAVWQDKNQNGIVDKGEMTMLKDAGITSISTAYKNFVGSFARNGKTYKMWDWWPSAMELRAVSIK